MEIPNPAVKAVSFAKEFREFVLRTNILSMALGVIVGAAAGNVVNALVRDVLGGFVKAVQEHSGGWDALNVSVWRFSFRFGPMVSALIEFVLVAAVVFLITKLFMRQAAPPPVKTCPECLEGIHPDAARCKHCTAVQPKPAPPAAA